MIKLVLLTVIALAAAGSCETCTQDLEQAWTELQSSLQELEAQVPQLDYLATGDSVVAGADLEPGCERDSSCERREQAFPALVPSVAMMDGVIVNASSVACTGATSGQYLTEAQCGLSSPQVQFAQQEHWDVVSVTVGADDFIRWLQSNWQCVADEGVAALLGKDAEDCDLYANVIEPLRRNLRDVLQAATSSADVVLVTQYYHVFSPSFMPTVVVLPYEWTSGLNAGIDLMDDTIADVAAEFATNTVLVDLRPVFATHEWGDLDSYLAGRHECSGLQRLSPECAFVPGIHPNAKGQEAIAEEMWQVMYRELVQRGHLLTQ